MQAWIIWLIVAAVAAAGEVATTGLFLGTAAVAALVAAALAVFLPGAVQVLAFAALTLTGIAVVRPLVLHGLHLESTSQHTGPLIQRHIVGRLAVAMRDIDAQAGQIRIGEGEFWSARSFDPSVRIHMGQTVQIVLVEGITALVAPPDVQPPSVETELRSSHDKGEPS